VLFYAHAEDDMPDDVRIGALVLKFLIDDANNDGRLVMFEMTVPEKAKVPAPHYHRDFDEALYGLAGTLTMTIDGAVREVTPGEAVFVPRGAVHQFQNLHAGDARVLVTLTPAIAGRKYFEELATVVNAGGPPDMAKVKETMLKYGLVPA
jgi:quercetin dioxygenase-like cupin family protein